VAQVGLEAEAGRVFILSYLADSRYMRKLRVLMIIIIIYPVEMECKGIAVKYVMKMYGGMKVLARIFKRYGG
jgi:hypothetical protein